MSAVREPAVAGRFYPGDGAELAREVERHLAAGSAAGRPARAALGVVAPHAGYVYSGGVAGKVFAAVEVPARVVVLAPNHTGLGWRISLVTRGVFRMPGGDVPIDAELAAAILEEIPGARDDLRAHVREHAVEVELPFLCARNPALRFVPIVLGGLDEDEAIATGEGLARALDGAGGDVLVVATSDMSQYLGDAETRVRDRPAIDAMLAVDARALHRVVEREEISMCGTLAAAAMLACARARGAATADLVGYATSGDAFGDRDRVVGYAGIVVS